MMPVTCGQNLSLGVCACTTGEFHLVWNGGQFRGERLNSRGNRLRCRGGFPTVTTCRRE